MIRELCSRPSTGDALHANRLRDLLLHAASVCQPGGNRGDNQCCFPALGSSLSLSLSLFLWVSSVSLMHILKNDSCMEYILNISMALRLDAELLLPPEKSIDQTET